MSSTAIPKVVPAQLSFLAIYSPALGTSDETFHQQIVFYYSKAAKARSKLKDGDTRRKQELREEENEKLRQVGLAQGMSIDLTQLPAPTGLTRTDSSTDTTEPVIEYSAREVSPPQLLIQQLLRAQSTFLLHHGSTMEAMFAKYGRTKFCSILDKYWSRFSASWDVLLHGSPAVDIYGGMKLAAGGELGMGVGEEEWGSSERDVLEDFARRTTGLVDVMVSRFGEAPPLQQAKTSPDPKTLEVSELGPWIGAGRNVHASDGVVFSGLGAASMLPLGIPPPIVKAAENSLDKAAAAVENKAQADAPAPESKPMLASLGDTETWMKYMTLGYGTAWGGRKTTETPEPAVPAPALAPSRARERTPSPAAMRYVEPAPDVDPTEEKLKLQIRLENDGYFLVGLKGDLREVHDGEDDEGDWNNRIPLRTIHVEINRKNSSVGSTDVDSDDTPQYEKDMSVQSTTTGKLSRLRPVVYVGSVFGQTSKRHITFQYREHFKPFCEWYVE
ncbi:conserved hypothetical protein [Pyrenophora tritici-repentis Pt-1C-BFP]|uniref:CCZ1/INTU/HSP4 first Longin domain-containing protein n=1 Tax=Pyrenophora tritici-repentis (strain Pt-1C-BFP) TaxID=426418 RepID=B2W0W7_PYRTR|nr:uncharacterized protein PTRG_04102 [Pyrenophora tritici-repentis Pt-1C-BFP]EDU46940.1 conserved hypothetical protein [Pyrenophora tritici-repentis Pt-1C-BFP]